MDDPRLEPIRAALQRGQRLTLEQGDLLYTTPDIWSVCEMAHSVRTRLHGDIGYYNVNRHFNYSNVCALSCAFCEFYRKDGDDGAYTRSIDEAKAEARSAVAGGATELHIVGGLHPTQPFSFYTDMLSSIKEEAPQIHLKAFTAVEIVHLAKIARVFKSGDRTAGIRWVLERLKEAGLGSLPGGGAEVFDDRVHDEAFKGKIRSDVWLDVHRVAHELGLNSNATILYGHIEDRSERLVHMDMLRRAQDEALGRLGYTPDESGVVTLTKRGTAQPCVAQASQSKHEQAYKSEISATPIDGGGCFQTIIPLPFIPDGSALVHLPGPSGLENLRTLAICRLMLDNIPHVKAFWIMQTLDMAEVMLQSGADDIDGTVVWYDITKVGGASTHQETTAADLRRVIRQAGFEPVERDTLYRRVVRERITAS